VILSGYRPNETIAAGLRVGEGFMSLLTTEPPAADRSQPLAVRFPVSMPLWRRVLRPFKLESDVIERGEVLR